MEETTNWDPTYDNEDQKDKNNSAANKRNTLLKDENDYHVKSAEANGYDGSEDETSYQLTSDDHEDDEDENENEEDTGSSDWGSVDPQQDGRPSSNDPSGPGSAV